MRRSLGAVHVRRWILFAVVGAAFFWAALSNDVYNLTSPPTLSWHVVLRKLYSVVAFALVGAAFAWAAGASVRTTAVVIALYSGLIEVAQHLAFNNEPWGWNVVDIACGGLGGALGPLIPWVRAK